MSKKSLIIRAPNWIGDTIYCLPVWQRLSAQYDLHIVGKGWLRDLLSGYPDWKTYALSKRTLDNKKIYQNIKHQLGKTLNQPINAIVYPTSFGSVLHMKLAGLRILGHAHEARGWLLTQALPMPAAQSSIYKRYWALSNYFLHENIDAPAQIDYQILPEIERSAQLILAANDLQPHTYIAVCPFAVGNLEGFDKKWPHFNEWAQKMQQAGYRLVCCPAPNEISDWQDKYSSIPALEGLSLAQYASVLKSALCVVANDTGPGHLAAAVGAPLVSVLNRTNRETYGAVGSNVSAVQVAGWPSVDEVFEHVVDRVYK